MEQDLIAQVRQRLRELDMTQDELAKKAFGPDAGRQHVNPYLTGTRGLLSGNGIKLLRALGMTRLRAEWEPDRSTPGNAGLTPGP